MRNKDSEKKGRGVVPRLRFPSYSNPWVPTTLGMKGEFYRGLTYASSDVSDEGTLVVRSSNIQEGKLDLQSDLVFVNKTVPDEIVLRANDIAICMSNGSKKLVGKSAYFDGSHNGRITIGAFCSIYRSSTPLTRYIFETDEYAAFVGVAIGGGNINNLKNSDLESFNVGLPSHEDEQEKIVSCLSSIDACVDAETRKLEALKAHKQSLMQQLFPAEGERVPRLRLARFRKAWSNAKLGDLSVVVRGGSPRPIDSYMTDADDGLSWLKIGDVDKASKYIERTREKVIPAALGKTRQIHPGDLILSNSMSFGRPYISKIVACIHDGWLAITEIQKQVDQEFLYYFLSSEVSQAYFQTLAAGSGVKNLNADSIKQLPLSFPDQAEQQQITSCLSFLDELLEKQSSKIALLEQHKRGLMQGLFPSSRMQVP